MELVPDTTCLLCKQQTTVLKLDNVKSYLDKLFDTFFDKSNIFKDEFQGMVENASLCLSCTSKVNICCNLRIDYEEKYNGKFLQKIINSSNCLLCDNNSASLAKTQDMPSSLLQKIELFMNSTSFPESYSNSVLCLTCIHFLNIWHQVRSSVMELKQNDEIDENYGASTDNSKKTKTTNNCTIDKNNEKLTVIELVDSDTEVVENPRSITQSLFKKSGSLPQDEANDVQSKASFSDDSRFESPSLINNKFSKKFHIQQKTKQLKNKQVIDKESSISDSCNSEIDSLSKIVDDIIESYENEEGTLQSNSLNLCCTEEKNFDDELSITTIGDSSDNENESNITSQHLSGKALNCSLPDGEKSSEYFSTTSSNFTMINSNCTTKKTKFTSTMQNSSGSGIINENNSQRSNPKLKLRRGSVYSIPSPEFESLDNKRSDNEDREKTPKNDEGCIKKNTPKLKHRLPSLPKKTQNHTRSNNEDQVKGTKIDDWSNSENQLNTPQILSSKSSNFSKKNPRWISKNKTVWNDSSDCEIIIKTSTPKLNQNLNLSRPSTCSKASSQSEGEKRKGYNNEDQGKETIIIDYSSDEERIQKISQKLKHRRLSALLPKQIPKPKINSILKTPENNKFNEQEQAIYSESETTLIENFSDNASERITKISTSYLPNKISSETETSTNKKIIDQISDSSDCESVPDKETSHLKNISSKTNTENADKNQSKTSNITEEFLMGINLRRSSYRKQSTDQQIILSSDQEKAKTVSSKLGKGEYAEINKNRDSLWFYLNKKLDKLQSVEKLHKIKKINLPKNGLDDKFYKQLPYVFLNHDEVQTTKMVIENLPKIRFGRQKRKLTDKELNRPAAQRTNKSPITIAPSDGESHDIVNTPLGEFKIWCCQICDKTSRTLWEHKAHELFHIKPEQVVINVVRENLKQLQEQYDRQAIKNINRILAKYLDISELEETSIQSNGNSSGSGCVEAKDRKSSIPLVNGKSSSTRDGNSACQITPNVNKRKRSHSILVNNSKDKSDGFLRTPKQVRFSLDNDKSRLPNLQSSEVAFR